MRCFGIKTPGSNLCKPYIYWIEEDEFKAWSRFFQERQHKFPMEEAKRAYQAIGYQCVELEVREVGDPGSGDDP